jgi:hypothetical protein
MLCEDSALGWNFGPVMCVCVCVSHCMRQECDERRREGGNLQELRKK